MSAQSAKKKRIGSRRRVTNQSKTSEADEFHVTDSMSVAQHCTLEENAESFSALANPDNSESKTPNSTELTGNRRKFGSSRRIKGGQHDMDSATESHHKPREDVETPRTTQMSPAVQTQRQEELSQGNERDMSSAHDSALYSAMTPDYSLEVQNYTEPGLEDMLPKHENLAAVPGGNYAEYEVEADSGDETMMEGTDNSETLQSEELLSESTSFCPIADQQLNDQSNSTGMPEELSNVYSVTEKHIKERDEGTDGNLQVDYLLRGPHVEFSTAPETTTDGSGPKEKNEFELSIEQSLFSSQHELPENEEHNEHFDSQDKSVQQSEDVVNKEHEVESKEMHEINQSSESVTHDVTENSEMDSGNLIDKAEGSDTYQSEESVRGTDYSPTKQRDATSGDKQDVPSTKESNFDLSDTKELQVSGTEIGIGQVYETEGQLEDYIKPSGEQAVHQHKEGFFPETEESNTSLQTLQSEMHPPVDSEPQPNDTSFNPIGNKRKLGSSRRSKGRQQTKDYHRPTEDSGQGGNEPFDTTVETTVPEKTIETTLEGMDMFYIAQTEETRHQVKEYAHVGTLVGISAVSTSEMPEELPDGDNESEMLTPQGNLQGNYLVSYSPIKSEDPESFMALVLSTGEQSPREQPECSVEQTVVVAPREEMPTKEEQNDILSEVKCFHHSEEPVIVVHEQDVKPTQMHDMHQTYFPSIQEDESSLKSLHSEVDAPSDCRPQDSSVRLEEETHTGFHPVENRCENGSSQRNTGDESYQEHKEQVVEGAMGDKALETTQVMVETETTSQEELSQESQSDIVMPAPHDSSLYSAIVSGFSPEVKTATNRPVGDLESLILTSENLQVNHDEKQTDFKVEVPDESVGETLEGTDQIETHQVKEISAETTVHQLEVMHEINQSPESHFATESSENLKAETSATYQFEMKNSDNSATKQEDSNFDDKQPTKENSFEVLEQKNGNCYTFDTDKLQISDTERVDTEIVQVYEIEGRVEEDIQPSVEPTADQGNLSGLVSEMEDSNSLQAITHYPNPNSTEMPEELPGVHSVIESKSKDNEMLRQDDNFVINVESNVAETSITLEKSVEDISLGCSSQQAAFSTEKEPVNSSEWRGLLHPEDEVHEEATRIQEMHSIDFSSIELSESSLQTPQSEINSPLGCQSLDNLVSTEEQTNTGVNRIGNRRKLGSSRRHKGQHHVKDSDKDKHSQAKEFVENTRGDETLETTSNPSEDFNEEENSTKEPENQLAQCDSVKMPLTHSSEDDSNIQNVSDNDGNVTMKSVTLGVLEQEEHQVQKAEALSRDKVNLQQRSDATETVRDTKAGRSMDVQVCAQEEAGENDEEAVQTDHVAQEMKASEEMPCVEFLSAAHNKTDTLAPFGVEENIRAESAVDVPEESGVTTAVNELNSQQDMQEKAHLDSSENVEGESKQKRRKMGSTRRTQNKKSKKEEDETKDRELITQTDEMKVMEEVLMTETEEGSQNENASLNPVYNEQQVPDKGSTSDLQSIQSYVIPDDLPALNSGRSTSLNQENNNPATFVQVTDTGDGYVNDFTGKEMHITTGFTEGSFVRETTQNTQNDEDTSESVSAIQHQAVKSVEAPVVAVADLEIVKSAVRGEAPEGHEDVQASLQEQDNTNEGALKDLDMKNTSPSLNSPHRRRKMGSTRRNLGSQSRREAPPKKQDVGIEATEAQINEGETTASSQKKVFETVEYSHAGESHFKPPSHQTFQEDPASQGQVKETEHHLSPNYFMSTSPKHDVTSEMVSGGRRRKMGSHRKSHGHHSKENQPVEAERITDMQNDSAIKTTEEGSLGLEEISEVDVEVHKKSSSTISALKPVSETTPVRENPVQHPSAEICLRPGSQKTFTLAGSSRGAAPSSNSYSVLLVGDSSVGKTSFMKRAQSGKFSLDLPASVGFDSCMWTVVVDGKPVVLQLWDTAGQERFHSITRQMFHKAQAFLLMYDITSSQSFCAVSYWATCIQEGAAENTTILLVGNKSDRAERQVKTQEGESLAKEYNFEFMECSAASGENVIHCLEAVARMLSQKFDTREETTVLHKAPQQKKSAGCC